MAETIVTKTATPSTDATTGMLAPQVSGLLAGENIPTVATPVYIKSDGKLWIATAAAANAAARAIGISTRACKAGQPCTPHGLGVLFRYSDGNLTPGNLYYLGETAGAISSIATTGDANGVARAVDAYNLQWIRP